MKVTTYTLDADGCIPDYVIEGGVFPKPTDGTFPQDIIFVGICTDESPNNAYSLEQLTSYVNSYYDEYVDSITGQTIHVSEKVQEWWGAAEGTVTPL